MEKLLEIFNIIRKNKGYSSIDSLSNKMRLRDDIGFDSFDLAELTVRIEDEFNIDIFEDGIVNNIAEIKKKLGINE